jgi:mono/diheme cytochrome c family protein
MNNEQFGSRERARRWRGFLAGVTTTTALAALACATAGSRAGGTTTTKSQPSSTAKTAAVAPTPAPTRVPPPMPTPAPTAAAAAASAAKSASSSAPAAPGQSPSSGALAGPAAAGDAAAKVAAYRADPQAMLRASQLFRAVCTGYCHTTQPAADRVAPNLFDCEWIHGGSDAEIFHTIYTGVPDTQMQGFGERLPEEDLWKMVAFIRQKQPSCPGSAG